MNQDPIKVLLIDDEQSIHDAVKLTVRRQPYLLLSAYDAAEGLHLIESDPGIRGVICDQNLPGTSGLELLVALRLRRPDLPTMLLTGQASVELASHAVNEAGVRGFLPKPWSGPAFRALLHDMLTPDGPLPSPEGRAVEAVEQTLREELAPTRDPATGAFIIDEESL